MKIIRKLPDVDELQYEYSLTRQQINSRTEFICNIQNILAGKDSRKIIIVGPCSADKADAVIDYSCRLAQLADNVKDKFFIVPRIYTSKPRTTGIGYKGMLHNPMGGTQEDLLNGIIATRRLHLSVISYTGLYTADEMLYPEEIYYISDLVAYMAVGARSVEDQGHRMVASDNQVPVGMKNPTGGSKLGMVNSVMAAQASHRMMYRGWEVETEGNPYAHCILRGFTNTNGKNYANYHYEDIRELYDLCVQYRINNPGVIIDCNHANSNKEYDEQPRIARETTGYCQENKTINSFVKGLMIESYIEDGCQQVGNGVYGKSITDPCLGWDKTERLIKELAEKL